MEEINLSGQSFDIVKENVSKLKQLFPEIVTEDNIDFDKLKAVLGDYIEKDDESYRFTWHGKRDAFRKSQMPSTGTLRPCVEESKDWDTTKNLYIEGDNLEVLKLLQKSYNNAIKMIYIDPPYNKDKDFIYPDKWSDPIKEYKKITGQTDEEGNITSSETEDEGGRHTKWLNMIYPRLRIAKNLLDDDGVIFISVDDDEIENLKKICNEVFGEENFLNQIVLENDSRARPYGSVSTTHEYILAYSKETNFAYQILFNDNKEFKYSDELGGFDLYELRNRNIAFNIENRPNLYYPFWVNPNNQDSNGLFEISLSGNEGWIEVYPQESQGVKTVWRWGKEKALENLNTILFAKEASSDSGFQIVKKYRANTYVLNTVWTDKDIKTDRGTLETKKLFDNKKYFDFPKPVDLIKRLLKLGSCSESIILDFFSGSSTTAHAVMQLNAEVGSNRKYIMVQLPEIVDKKSDAYIAGFTNIAEIGKERIRRAGDAIKAELKEKYDEYQQKQQFILEDEEQLPINPEDLDIGFKVFKLDNSNLKKWSVDVGEEFYKESKETQNAILSEMLGLEVNNFVEGRSELDVVYEVMLKYGLDLTYPIETYNFEGKNIYSIGYGGLIVCLDTDIKAELVDKIVELIKELEPSMVRVAVRDLSFKSDSAKTNFKETLKNGVYAYFESTDDKADKQNQFKFITI